jgi:hypothetical protein
MAGLRPVKMAVLKPVKPMQPTKGLKLGTVPGFKAAPGRPASNIGKYLIKPTPEQRTGYEMLNTEPLVLDQAKDMYLKKWELPPALQPKYLRKPEVMETQRTKKISKGFVKPRSRQG